MKGKELHNMTDEELQTKLGELKRSCSTSASATRPASSKTL